MRSLFVTVLVTLVAIASAVQAIAPHPEACLVDDDCSPLECCHKTPDQLAPGRRQLMPIIGTELGKCEPYKAAGESCDIFGTQNGGCECNVKEGYTCQAFMTAPGINPGSEPHRCLNSLEDSKK